MRVCCFAATLLYVTGALAFGQAGQLTPPSQLGESAQTTAALPTLTRDPQALVLLSQAIAHLRSAPGPVADLTLTANASYTAGSDHETGTATLEASDRSSYSAVFVGMARVVLQLEGGAREQIRNGFAGAWTGKDGAPHASALQNCFTDASWFAPLLILEAAANPAVSITLAPNRQPGGSGNPGIVISRVIPNQSAVITARIQKLSMETLYLDASTLLPVELDFNLHPDNDASRNIPIQIRFSDYRPVNGALVPFHIQKYVQRSLLLDLQVTAVTVNSGIAASEFALPAVAASQGVSHENREPLSC